MLEYSFMDNVTYGADDVNAAFAKLTTKGVTLYKDNTSETAANALNNAFAQYTTRGVELYNPNACKVIGTREGVLTVLEGTAIMGNGAMVSVTEREVITYSTKIKNQYVYFDTNTAYNRIDLIVSETEPTGTNYVMLAKLYYSTVTDARMFAQTKLAPSLPNMYVQKNNITFTMDINSPAFQKTIAVEIDAGWVGWNYVYIEYSYWGGSSDSGTKLLCLRDENKEMPWGSFNVEFAKTGSSLTISYGRHGDSGKDMNCTINVLFL